MIWQWHNGIYRKARGWYSQLQEKGITKKNYKFQSNVEPTNAANC